MALGFAVHGGVGAGARGFGSAAVVARRGVRAAPARRRAAVRMEAADKDADFNEMEFVMIDPKSNKKVNLSLTEKENMFLDALHSFFVGKPLLTNSEFDLLKSDLTWEGSPVATLDREELVFLEAARAYNDGNPTMDDKEYDKLKKKLIEAGSVVAISKGPQCSMVTQTCWSDCREEKGRELVLVLPAVGILAIVWAVISYEFTPLRDYNPLLSLLVGSPIIWFGANILTGLALPAPRMILAGQCPNCGAENRFYFGDVVFEKGFQDFAEVQCDNCKSDLRVDRERRQVELVNSKQAPSPKVTMAAR